MKKPCYESLIQMIRLAIEFVVWSIEDGGLDEDYAFIILAELVSAERLASNRLWEGYSAEGDADQVQARCMLRAAQCRIPGASANAMVQG